MYVYLRFVDGAECPLRCKEIMTGATCGTGYFTLPEYMISSPLMDVLFNFDLQMSCVFSL